MRVLLPALAVLLVIPQTGDARGGGGGGGGHGGGGHGGGTVGFFSAGTFGFTPIFPPVVRSHVVRAPFVRPFARQQFRFTDGRVPFRDNRFDNRSDRFDGRVGNRFAGQRFDGGTGSTGWWPVGGWSDGGGYSQAAAPLSPADPQVIVLTENNPAQRVAVIEPGHYSYAGCHPIPNGYRCGQ